MDWREHIYSNPNIYAGKPIFRDSRITVELVLDLIGAGWSIDRMADEYPGVLPAYVAAAGAFAAEMIHDETAMAASRARAA